MPGVIVILEYILEIGTLVVKGVLGAGEAYTKAKSIYQTIKGENRDPTPEEIAKVESLWKDLEEDFMQDDEPLAPQAQS